MTTQLATDEAWLSDETTRLTAAAALLAQAAANLQA
jgi:hypothetical protein